MSKKPKVAKRETSQSHRLKMLSPLTNQIGVYAICDLDGVPIYVGQSVDGIRARVQRHLTSARSDIIANRQIDVWEIAYVKAWVVDEASDIPQLEAVLFSGFDHQKTLMNGSILKVMGAMPVKLPEPTQIVQIMSDHDIKVRCDPALRMPRQIEHIGRLVDHLLNVKDTRQLRRSLNAHFERLQAYREAFLQEGTPVVRAPGQPDEAE